VKEPKVFFRFWTRIKVALPIRKVWVEAKFDGLGITSARFRSSENNYTTE
jgi:hypothetical protein